MAINIIPEKLINAKVYAGDGNTLVALADMDLHICDAAQPGPRDQLPARIRPRLPEGSLRRVLES